MEETRNYMDTLSRGLKAWDYWVHNGNTIITNMGAEKYLYVIQSDTDEICNLNANKVKDEILDRKDDISFRIKRIEKYGLLPLLQYLEDFKNTKVTLDDEAVSNAINTYFLRIYEKANDLCRVMAEAESFVKPKNPIIEKGLADPLLCSYFYDNKKVLEDYLNFCLSADNIKLKAIRAMELADKGKIKKDYVRKPLHSALGKIGLKVGSYPQWNASINT